MQRNRAETQTVRVIPDAFIQEGVLCFDHHAAGQNHPGQSLLIARVHKLFW